MRLDRNLSGNRGRGKYALLLLRRLKDFQIDAPEYDPAVLDALAVLDGVGLIEWGELFSDEEFFVMKLRDRHASIALHAYAGCCSLHGDREFAREVEELANRAGPYHPKCKSFQTLK